MNGGRKFVHNIHPVPDGFICPFLADRFTCNIHLGGSHIHRYDFETYRNGLPAIWITAKNTDPGIKIHFA